MIPNTVYSNLIGGFFAEKGVVWWRTPPESLDLNPTENVWGSLKQFLRMTCKPHDFQNSKEGIQEFWNTLTPDVCRRYINHLYKVVPKRTAWLLTGIKSNYSDACNHSNF